MTLTLSHTIHAEEEGCRKYLREKGENAGNQHFLLFPQCFLSYHKQILSFEAYLKCRLQMLSILINLTFCCSVKDLTPCHIIQHFLLFPRCFLSYQRVFCHFSATFKLSSANALNLEKSNILSFGKEFTPYHIFKHFLLFPICFLSYQ